MSSVIKATRRILSGMSRNSGADDSTIASTTTPDVIFNVAMNAAALRGDADRLADGDALVRYLFSGVNEVDNEIGEIDEVVVFGACGVAAMCGAPMLGRMEAGIQEFLSAVCTAVSPLRSDLKLRAALITGFGCIYGAVRNPSNIKEGQAEPSDFGLTIVIPTALASIDLDLASNTTTSMQHVFSLETATALLEQVLTAQTHLPPNNSLNASILAAAMSCVQNSRQWLSKFSNTQYFSDAGAASVATPSSIDVPTIIKVLSRRVLVPLLSQNLGSNVPDSARVMAEGLVEQLASTGQTAEVVMVAASLFELLFVNRSNPSNSAHITAASSPEVFKRTDFRFNSILWDVIMAVLRDGMTNEAISSVQRSTLELQASYMLKRIVSVCEDESGIAHADKRGDPTSSSSTNKAGSASGARQKKGKYADPNKHPLTSEPSPSSSGTIVTDVQHFSPVFNWCPKGSSSVWNSFFLVLETLTEYGVHIVTPALDKITTELVPATKLNLIHPGWVELLIIKGLRHGNTGVRKATLGVLWSMDSSVLLAFSPEMLCQGALETAVDGRLATEVDKIVTPTNFLQVTARDFTDIPISSVTPIVNDIVSFYSSYLTAVAAAGSPDLAPPEEIVTLMLLTISDTSPRFSIATTLRVVMEVCQSVPVVTLNGDVVYALLKVYKESIVDKHPQWMQARLVSMCVDTALAVAAQTRECHSEEFYYAFERLIGVCGKGGDEGRLDLQLDAPGISQGSVLGVRPVVDRFVSTVISTTTSTNPILQRYLTTAVSQMHELINSRDEIPISTVKAFATKAAVLISYEASIGTPEADRAIWLILGAFTGAAASVVDRAYCDLSQQINALRLFSEVVSAVGWQDVSGVVSGDVVKTICQGANALLTGWVTSLFSSMPPACSSDQFDTVCDSLSVSIAVLAASGEIELGVYSMYLSEWTALLSRALLAGSSGTDLIGVLVRQITRVLHALCVPFAALKKDGGGSDDAAASSSKQLLSTPLLQFLPSAVPVLLLIPNPPTPGTAAAAELAGFSGIGAVQSMTSRYVLNTLLCLASAATDGDNTHDSCGIPEFCKGVLGGDWLSDAVDVCASSNLPQLFSLVATLSKLALCGCTEIPTMIEDAFILVWSRQRAADRRAAIQCGGIAYQMLAVLSSVDPSRTTQMIHDILSNEAETDRTAFFATLVSCSSALSQHVSSGVVDTALVELLVHQCCIVNRGSLGENEMESCVAVVETPFLTWPDSVRRAFPASPSVVSVSRALSISTLLDICQRNPDTTGADVFIRLIAMLKSHPDVTREPCMPNSKAHRCRLRILQVLSLMLPMIAVGSTAFTTLTTFLFDVALLQNNMGSIRKHYEVLAIHVIVASPSLIIPHLSRHLADFDLKAQSAASIAKVAINVMLHLQERECELAAAHHQQSTTITTSRDIYIFLQRLGNSYQHLLKIVAHIGAHAYLTRRKATLSMAGESLSEDDARFLFYLENAGEVLKFRDKHYDVVVFKWREDLSPMSLLCVQRMEGLYWLQDCIGWETFWRCGGLVNEVASILRLSYPMESLVAAGIVKGLFGDRQCAVIKGVMGELLQAGLIPDPSPPVVIDGSSPSAMTLTSSTLCFDDALRQLSLAYDRLSGKQGGANHSRHNDDDGDVPIADQGGNAVANMQRKVQSWWTSEVYNELHPRSLGRAQRQPLVIVGSLLENPVNIAGLCRCADIFAIEGVVVPNKRVFEHPHFIAAARSAEKWIEWEEIPETGLVSYLRRMRARGYTTVGVEQTADSESMATYKFPERAVVVLGSEGKGIPPGILPFLDVCVEIPQFGLIRSLNVHVTGALAMYEYTKQHLMTTTQGQ